MHTYVIKKAATNVSVELEIVDDTDGTPETGVLFNTAGINLQYRRDGAVSTAITEVTLAALTTAHTDGGFLHIANGVYRFDIPDAAFATGVDKVVVHGTVTGMVVIPCVIQLVSYDPFDAVRMGMTALPNAAADAAGGLPISDAGGLDIDAKIGAMTYTVANQLDSNMLAISSDTTAADNLESQYDTTGLSGDNYPATQSQLSGITNSGSAVNKPASSYTLTTGTQSANLYTDTESLNGTRHTHTDAAGVMSLVYHFLIGAGTPASVQVSGYVTGSNDDIDVYGYDHVTASYKQIGNIQGSSSTSNSVYSFDLFVNMVGSGSDLGKVDIKFEKASGLSTATLAIDQIFAAYNQGAASTLDAIYFDSSVSNTNTVYGTDGIPGNPVSTEAAVNALLASSGLHKIQSSTDSSITFATAHTNEVWNGEGWTLALGGQNISQTHIHHCNDVSGIATTPTGEAHILNSHLGALTIGACHITGGSLKSTFTAGAAGGYHIENAASGVAGSGVPTLTYSGLLAATTINVRGWLGGGTWVFDSDCTASIEVLLGGAHTITTGGGNIEFRGSPKSLTVTTSGAGTTNIVIGNGAPIVVNGAAGTVNVYGLHGGITGTYSGSVTDFGVDVTDIPDILLDTTEIGTAGAGLTEAGGTGDHLTALGGMSAGMKAEVNAELLDVIQTDTFAELSGVPAANSSIKDKLTWVFMLARNQIEQTATTTTVKADNTTTSVATSTVSDDGTTAQRNEFS